MWGFRLVCWFIVKCCKIGMILIEFTNRMLKMRSVWITLRSTSGLRVTLSYLGMNRKYEQIAIFNVDGVGLLFWLIAKLNLFFIQIQLIYPRLVCYVRKLIQILHLHWKKKWHWIYTRSIYRYITYWKFLSDELKVIS